MRTYKLVGKEPVECDINDIMLHDDRIIAKDYFGSVKISTVFLIFDHSIMSKTPILFETMIFGGEYDGYQERYSNYEDSFIGHKKACDLVNKL